MIVLTTKEQGGGWYRQLSKVRGTALASIGPRVMILTALSALVTYLHHFHAWFQYSLTPLPFTFMGLALSVFLGFRNNTSYDRFWEGRKLWGQLVNTSRSFSRQIITQIDEPAHLTQNSLKVQLSYYLMAYAHSLRSHLRGDSREQAEALLSPADAQALGQWSHPPLLIALRMGEYLKQAHQNQWIDTLKLTLLEQKLDELINVQGGCERIKSTPVPVGYLALLHQLVSIYCLALPFGIVDQTHLLTPVVVLMVAYAFLGLDAVGSLYEDPFKNEPSDLPLSAICRTIEINVRQQLGETELPAPLKPDQNYILM